MSFILGAKSEAALVGVNPQLVAVVREAIKISHVDFTVREGVRAEERQKQLVAQGLSQTMNSKHLLQADGTGHAVDLVAVGDLDGNGVVDHKDASLTWDPLKYLDIARAMYVAAGRLKVDLHWGGLWLDFHDLVHFQLGL